MPTTEPIDGDTAESVLDLAQALIRRASVTPEDGGCQPLLAERLRQLGFEVESLRCGEVDNLWARRGDAAPLLVFAGHTDVVPPGDLEAWATPPFQPTVIDGRLHGRGAADMKGSLAAMVVALERFLTTTENWQGSLGVLLTSDEEGPAVDGTRAVVRQLEQRDVKIDYCVVGEPSSGEILGDRVRVGRRGSLNGTLRVRGVQGHVAYPDDVRNPIHAALGALDALARTRWDAGNAYFPPTSFQISNIRAGTGATNVVPGVLEAAFNFRFSTEQTPELLQARVAEILGAVELEHEVIWQLSGEPFLTAGGALVEAVRTAVVEVSGVEPELSTGGGTSDGRFIAPTGAEVVELGPCNATIHQVDEQVPVAHLERLVRVYREVMESLLTQ